MKLVKIFGVVMSVHAAVFLFIFAIPGCRSTGKKPATAASVTGSDSSPLAASEMGSPMGDPAPAADLAPVRFSPTRPGTAAAAEVVAPAPAAAAESYTVVKGDNLWAIAKKHGLTVKQLTAANNLRADSTLQLGQKLVIPGKSAAPAPAATTTSAVAPSAPAASSGSFTHVVKSGETLGGIAKKYQVKVGEIATANNIADPTKIRVGQTLKVPGWQAPAAKPAVVAPTFTPAAPVAPAPSSPLFDSPLIESPAPSTDAGSPFANPSSSSDTPIIRVEESGAPKIE
jgi:LysM repeat protein